MPKALNIGDLSGRVFGRLTVVEQTGVSTGGASKWVCKCACGTEKVIAARYLLRDETKSCGCLIRDVMAANNARRQLLGKTHGMHGTREYRSWNMMLQRCTNPRNTNYKHYGERGIQVCASWLKFEAFHQDMGARPIGMSLERMDVNGGYEPGNCKWATSVEQANNTRRSLRNRT